METTIVITIYGEGEKTQDVMVRYSELIPIPGQIGKYEVEEIKVLDVIRITPNDLHVDLLDAICLIEQLPVGSVKMFGEVEYKLTSELVRI